MIPFSSEKKREKKPAAHLFSWEERKKNKVFLLLSAFMSYMRGGKRERRAANASARLTLTSLVLFVSLIKSQQSVNVPLILLN